MEIRGQQDRSGKDAVSANQVSTTKTMAWDYGSLLGNQLKTWWCIRCVEA